MTLGKEHKDLQRLSSLVTGETGVSIQPAVKLNFFIFLSLETISIFYLPVFNPVTKNLLLGRKNPGGAFPPPPCIQPIDAYEYVNKKHVFVFIYLEFFSQLQISLISKSEIF
jgi:hypothetical protein